MRRLLEYKDVPAFNVLVFCSTKASAVNMHSYLQAEARTRPFIRPGLCIGHKGSEGMKTPAQLKARDHFRSNKCNVLVATSVLEEGIDVQGCNEVIRLNSVNTARASKQSQGRARKHGSRYHVIYYADSPEEAGWNRVQREEVAVEEGISEGISEGCMLSALLSQNHLKPPAKKVRNHVGEILQLHQQCYMPKDLPPPCYEPLPGGPPFRCQVSWPSVTGSAMLLGDEAPSKSAAKQKAAVKLQAQIALSK